MKMELKFKMMDTVMLILMKIKKMMMLASTKKVVLTAIITKMMHCLSVGMMKTKKRATKRCIRV